MRKNFSEILLSEESTIECAMKMLDATLAKVLYIVDENMHLVGSINDGDIRRGILRGKGLNEAVGSVMNKSPKYMKESDLPDKTKARRLVLEYGVQSLPVLNMEGIIVDVLFWTELFKESRKEAYIKKRNKVFILAGGKGSRLDPFTKILPKPLVPLGQQPIIEKIMDKFAFYGFDEFVLSTNYKAEMIKMYFSDPEVKNKYAGIIFIKEEKPLGTIGSLSLGKELVKETLFITNADIIVEEDMEKIFNFHKENGTILTIVGCIKNSVVPYGVISTDENGYLAGIEEKPMYRHVINTGIYVAEPEIVRYIEEGKAKDMNELIGDLLKEGKKISLYPIFEEQWFDVGQWAEYEKARKHFES